MRDQSSVILTMKDLLPFGGFFASHGMPSSRTVLSLLLVAYAMSNSTPAVVAAPAIAASPVGEAVTIYDPTESHLGHIRAALVDHPASFTAAMPQRWIVRLETSSGAAIPDARVVVDAYMPESGERSRPSPVTRYVGDGRYEIDGLRFSRSGWWNVSLAVGYARMSDSLAFNLLVP